MIVGGEKVARFVSDGLGFGLCPPYIALGTEVDGRIVNGVIFNHYEGSDIHVSAYGSRWRRQIMEAIGVYVFDMLGCARATIVTQFEAVARLAEKLGGVREGVMRDHYGKGIPGILIGVLRDEYRYMPPVLPTVSRSYMVAHSG